MQMPKHSNNPTQRYKQCIVCNKPFIGRHNQLMCDEHRLRSTQNRYYRAKQKELLLKKKDKNLTLTCDFLTTQTIIMKCIFCQDEHRFTWYPKQTIYPSTCGKRECICRM